MINSRPPQSYVPPAPAKAAPKESFINREGEWETPSRINREGEWEVDMRIGRNGEWTADGRA